MSLTKAQLKEIARSLKATDHPDYRAFLALIYAEAKARDPSYSYARMSEDLGVGSTNAHSVINGRRPLTEKAAAKICVALGLTGVQKRYFLALVHQERAKSTAEREDAFAERLSLRQSILPTELDRKQLAFFEHWYHSAILELMRLENAEDSVDWIFEHLFPQVPKPQIKESLDLLSELGYLKNDPQRDRLYPTDVTITTGNEILGLAVMSFHNQMLKLAMEAVETVDRDRRDISSVTLTASPALLAQFKEEIVALRKRFLQLAAEDQNAKEVVQVNFQLFPLTRWKV